VEGAVVQMNETEELQAVCYFCGMRDKEVIWEDGYEFTKCALCLYCANELDVEDIEEMPIVPIPVEEWYEQVK